MRIFAYDCECFSNFFYIAFSDGEHIVSFNHTSLAEVKKFVRFSDVLIGYNSFSYDDLMLRAILANPKITCAELKELNDRIINKGGRMPNDLWKQQYAPYPWGYSVDMFQIINKKGSLKEWECKIHHKTVVDSPVDFNAPLPDHMVAATKRYCDNDVVATWALYQKYKEQIDLRTKLREMYELGTRPYVLGDAGIAQAIFIKKYSDRTGGWSTTARSAASKSPDNTARVWQTTEIISPRVKFQTPEFQAFFSRFKAATLVGDSDGTSWSYANGAFNDPISLGGIQYQIGVGGLHSVDGPGRFAATKDVTIIDLDVTSYYPSLIIEENIFPKHLGPSFVTDYRGVRDMRLKAKKAGDKVVAEALKIVVNSTFGKFNDAYSPLRSIPSALRVTINGQLMLLMLIERLEMMGARMLSANTDGVTFMWHRDRTDELGKVVRAWEKDTKHQLEQAEYTAYARRDVNCYCAMKPDGKVKTKGAFEQALDPSKLITAKPDERIVKQAAMDYLMKGVPLHVTVNGSTDIRDFVYYQRTKGAGMYLGEERKPVGRTVRWYVPKEGPALRSVDKNGRYNTVAARCAMIMTLPDAVPANLDRSHYIREARHLVESITKRRKA